MPPCRCACTIRPIANKPTAASQAAYESNPLLKEQLEQIAGDTSDCPGGGRRRLAKRGACSCLSVSICWNHGLLKLVSTMSRAFTKEVDNELPPSVPERPVSVGPNPITPRGAHKIESLLQELEVAFKQKKATALHVMPDTCSRDGNYGSCSSSARSGSGLLWRTCCDPPTRPPKRDTDCWNR